MGSEFLGDSYSLNGVARVGETEEEKPTLSYTEIFYQCLPQYLAMGMSADEFWNCDPRMYRVYREKDRIENERKNELLWIAGAYVLEAIQTCLSTEKNPHRYPTEPFDLKLRPEEEVVETEMTDEEIQKTPQFVNVLDWMERVNKEKRGENNGG